MTQKWSKIRLGDICQTNQSTYSLSEKWDYVNYLDTGNLTQDQVTEYQHIVLGVDKLPSRARRKVKPNDILYSTVRPNQLHYGIVKNLLPNTLVSTGFAVISVDEEKANSDFVYYYLTQNDVTETLQAIGEQSTSAYPSIKPSDIEKLELNLPILDEQEGIAKTLRSLDEKIEINRQINHHLVDLIDTQFAEFQSTNEFPEKARLRDLFNTQTGTFNPKKSDEIEVRHFSIPAFDATSYPVIDEVTSIKSNKNIVSKYSVLFSKLNPTTKRVWVPFIKGELLSVASTEFLSLSGKTPSEQAMIFAIINSNDFQDYFKAHATGTTNSRQRTSPDVAYDYELPYDSGRFDEFGIQLAPLVEQIQNNSDEIQQLIKIRDSLLPKLMSGEISVID